MAKLFDVELVAVDCIHCFAHFGMTKDAVRRLKRSHKTFHCPYCRGGMHYPGESDLEYAERLRKEAEQSRARALESAAAADRRASALKGHLTRTKRRVGHGTCPCCKRTFKQLAAHMKNKHPEYAGGEEAQP